MYKTLIATDTLHGHIHDADWCIVDARFSLADTTLGMQDYQTAHIPGAHYAHLDKDLSGPIIPGKTGRHPLPAVEAAARTFSEWGIDHNVQVVVYDSVSGSVAARLWWMLKWLGHDAVAVLDGGWPAWQAAGLPVTQDLPSGSSRAFTADVRAQLLTDVAQVDRYRNDPAYRVFDARTPERYRGEQEPIDPVAGHIPGAHCASFAENIAEDGLFQSPEALRLRYEPLLAGIHTDHIISYCGSGVTACHNLLAMSHAGLGDAVLYAGSWSEWITDQGRPVGTEEG
jgi:thiosulfate/3-mercaptopyruvate sulfurtransferase